MSGRVRTWSQAGWAQAEGGTARTQERGVSGEQPAHPVRRGALPAQVAPPRAREGSASLHREPSPSLLPPTHQALPPAPLRALHSVPCPGVSCTAGLGAGPGCVLGLTVNLPAPLLLSACLVTQAPCASPGWTPGRPGACPCGGLRWSKGRPSPRCAAQGVARD